MGKRRVQGIVPVLANLSMILSEGRVHQSLFDRGITVERSRR